MTANGKKGGPPTARPEREEQPRERIAACLLDQARQGLDPFAKLEGSLRAYQPDPAPWDGARPTARQVFRALSKPRSRARLCRRWPSVRGTWIAEILTALMSAGAVMVSVEDRKYHRTELGEQIALALKASAAARSAGTRVHESEGAAPGTPSEEAESVQTEEDDERDRDRCAGDGADAARHVAPEPAAALDEALLVPAAPRSYTRLDSPNPVEVLPLADEEDDDPFRNVPPEARGEITHLEELSRAYEAEAAAPNTRKTYNRSWARFLRWCAANRVVPLPVHPHVLCVYLTSLAKADLSISTIEVCQAAIVRAHRAKGLAVPQSQHLVDLLRSLRRSLGPKGRRPAAVSIDQIRTIAGFGMGPITDLAIDPKDPLAIRDRAVLLVTYWGGLRRSETSALQVPWLQREAEGYVIRLPQSKGDQEGEGAFVGLELQAEELCPVRALDRWLRQRQLYTPADRGPVFPVAHVGLDYGSLYLGKALSPNGVYRLVRRRAEAAGFPKLQITPHGLRAGVLTEAARAGASLDAICRHARHKSLEQTLTYLRPATVLGRHSATRGLT